jgi:hypothetical protein
MDITMIVLFYDVIYGPELAVNEYYLLTIYHLSCKGIPENARNSIKMMG